DGGVRFAHQPRERGRAQKPTAGCSRLAPPLRRRSRALPRERPAVKPLRELLREQKAAPGRPLLARLRRRRWRVLPRLREAAAPRRKLAQNLQNLLMPVRERQ